MSTPHRAREFAQSIVDTGREALLVLDGNLRVVSANRAFYQAFKVIPEETEGQLLYELGDRQWDIPKLRELLEHVLPEQSIVEAFEVEHDFPDMGLRVMRLNARQMRQAPTRSATILLAIEDVTEHKRAEELIEAERTYAQNIIETVREPLLVLDEALRVVSANRSFYKTFLVTLEVTEGNRFDELGDRQWDIPRLRTLLEEIIPKQKEVLDFEVSHDFPGIGRKTMLLNAREVKTQAGERKLVLLAIEDITERKKSEAALEKHRAKLADANKWLSEERERTRATLESIGDAVITVDPKGIVEYLNPVAETLTGWRTDEAQGKPLEAVFNIVDERSRTPVPSVVTRCLEQGRVMGLDHHTILISRNGSEYAIQNSVAPIRSGNDEILGVVLVFTDVTTARRMEQKIAHQAAHDALTGLVNRAEFERRLQRVLETVHTEMGEYALCYLDLDEFKIINDTCGHTAGDELLRQLGGLLHEQVRQRDTLARLGGDEFGVLMEHCPLEQALRVANALRKAIETFRFVWKEKSFEIGVSIGLVPITEASASMTDVLSAADEACYVAKDTGGNRIYVYREDDAELARRRGAMQWVPAIQRALEENRLHLYFQPIVPVESDKKEGAHHELLLRMKDEAGHVVRPDSFLHAAERYHLATRIDRWVIATAFNWLTDHPRHIDRLHLCAINLSGQSLGDEESLKFIIQQFSEMNIPPEKICFELTETSAIANLSGARHFMYALKGLGCQFALDDFGSGLSSFDYLKTLPVDIVKIDGAFVVDIVGDPIDLAVVKSINEIAQAMGKQTVAESVENVAILEKLKLTEPGVDYAQGFAIGRPQPIDEMA